MCWTGLQSLQYLVSERVSGISSGNRSTVSNLYPPAPQPLYTPTVLIFYFFFKVCSSSFLLSLPSLSSNVPSPLFFSFSSSLSFFRFKPPLKRSSCYANTPHCSLPPPPRFPPASPSPPPPPLHQHIAFSYALSFPSYQICCINFLPKPLFGLSGNQFISSKKKLIIAADY